ncbi:hypothetical protein [Ferrovibrio sp.]|uniref:hypothetical protein n=1 Tax=Ferrovibrio sp. TaxID=1917215 RepID=UPI0035B11355
MDRIIAAILALLTSGCLATENRYYGKGPVPSLSANIRADLVGYFSTKQNDRAYAVTADGQHAGRSYCNVQSETQGRCTGIDQTAVSICERRSNGRPCYVIASGNEIVWRDESGAIPTLSSLTAGAAGGLGTRMLPSGEYTATLAPAQPQPQRPAAKPTIRPVALNWEGVGSPIAATAEFVGSMTSGTIKIGLPSDECQGSFAMSGNAGSWAVSCKSGLTASGTANSKGADEFNGSGVDSKNRKVTFALGKGV